MSNSRPANANGAEYCSAVIAEAVATSGADLTRNPSCADLLAVRGRLASRAGQLEFAVLCLRRAAELEPDNARYALDLGDLLERSGNHAEALNAYLRALTLERHDPDVYRKLGRTLLRRRNLHEALVAFQEAHRLLPDDVEVACELGDVLLAQGRSSDALEHYRSCLLRAPSNAAAHHRLAQAHVARKEWRDGAVHFREAIHHSPANPPLSAELHLGLGSTLFRLGDVEQAIDAFQTALAISPHQIDAAQLLVQAFEWLGRTGDAVGAWCHLAAAYANADRFREAAMAYRQAIARKPDCLKAWVKLGQAHLELAEPREALDAYRSALAIDPEHRWAHNGVGWASLALGDFQNGWAGFAWRQREIERERRDFEQPVWDGSPLNGRRILLWADQGLGDALQFFRYVRLVKEFGAHVIVECYGPLVSLVRRAPWVDDVRVKGGPLPPFDTHVPFASLPRVCQRLSATIPADVPYLSVDPGLVETWRRRLGPSHQPVVGLVWAGAPSRKDARFRYAPLAAFQPLSCVERVRLISLQLGPQADELMAQPPGLRVEQLLDESCTIDDTAALLHALDLVISVDTMVVHLAGALARPVWTLLPYACDWRWQSDGDASVWYPTMRLFRQTKAGDWRGALERTAAALARRHPESPLPGAI